MEKIKNLSNSKKITLIIAILAIILSVLTIIFAKKFDFNDKPQKTGEVVAIINSAKIYRSDLDLRLRTLSPDLKISLEDLPENILKAMIMEAYINEKIDTKAAENGYTNNSEINIATKEFRKNLIREKFLNDKVFSLITEEKVKGEYDRLVKSLEGKEERKISHILVETKAEAERTKRGITSNERFARLAKEKSIDKASAENNGSLGYVLKEELVPEFGDVAFLLKTGEISKPVETKFGWHIIKVDDVRPATFAKFDDVKENLTQRLRQEAVQKFLENETKNADIKINIKSKQQPVLDVTGDQPVEVK